MVRVNATTTKTATFNEHRYSTYAHFLADISKNKRIEVNSTVVILTKDKIRIWDRVWDFSRSYPADRKHQRTAQRLAWLELCRLNRIRPEGQTKVASDDPAYDWPRYKGPIPG
jgi:hypothetical protein